MKHHVVLDKEDLKEMVSIYLRQRYGLAPESGDIMVSEDITVELYAVPCERPDQCALCGRKDFTQVPSFSVMTARSETNTTANSTPGPGAGDNEEWDDPNVYTGTLLPGETFEPPSKILSSTDSDADDVDSEEELGASIFALRAQSEALKETKSPKTRGRRNHV